MKIAVAADHGGFELKELLVPFMRELGHEVEDKGCFSSESVDYPDFAIPAAEAVSKGECERAVLICGTGVGMSIAANKVSGVRCALCADPLTARLTREHNDSNALAMGARIIGSELAKEIVRVWLSTDFSGGRHCRRIDKITAYER